MYMVPPPIGNIDTGGFPDSLHVQLHSSMNLLVEKTTSLLKVLTFVIRVTCLYFSFFDVKAHTQAENVPTVIDVHGVFLEPRDGR